MRILHVLSQTEVTGAETYAATLIAEQVRLGHEVVVVSDTWATPTPAEHVSMPIARRDFPHRIRNVIGLRRLIRRRRIDLVNAHSRAASWVAFFATRFCGVPLVSTVHSRQWIPIQSRWYSIYGERIVPVSEALREHLIQDLALPVSRIRLVPNAIDTGRFKPRRDALEVRRELGLEGGPVIVLVSRLSRGKGQVARYFIEQVFGRVREAVPDVALVVVGGMRMSADFVQMVADMNRRIGGRPIQLLGHRPNVADYMQAADVVVGSGSVAMEAMALAKPVVALGESQYVGVVSESCAPRARASFFGDHEPPVSRHPGRVGDDIIAVLNDVERRAQLGRWGKTFVQQEYGVERVAAALEDVYRQARLARGAAHIPVLMYHKVVSGPVSGSRHGTWVTAERFAHQLSSLQRRGITPVTLGDVLAAANGERPLPRRPVILTFDDGYLDNYTNAFPILQRLGMRAVVFPVLGAGITDNVWDRGTGEPTAPLLTRGHMREMARAGIEFGSHTMTHPPLTEVGEEALHAELRDSKQELESVLGESVLSVCYPYGAVNERVKRAARAAGYQFGFATISGPIRFDEDLLEIRRVHILPWSDAFQFWKRSSAWYFRYKTLKGNLPQHPAPRASGPCREVARVADADKASASHHPVAI